MLVAGLLLLGLPGPAYLVSSDLGWVLALSAVRGVGFGVLTVIGSAVVADLVPASRRGAAIGVYGLSVAVPNLLLLPGSVPVVDRWGFGPVFWVAALPVSGCLSAYGWPGCCATGRWAADGRCRRVASDPTRAARHRRADRGAVQRDHGRRGGAHLRAPVHRRTRPRWCC